MSGGFLHPHEKVAGALPLCNPMRKNSATGVAGLSVSRSASACWYRPQTSRQYCHSPVRVDFPLPIPDCCACCPPKAEIDHFYDLCGVRCAELPLFFLGSGSWRPYDSVSASPPPCGPSRGRAALVLTTPRAPSYGSGGGGGQIWESSMRPWGYRTSLIRLLTGDPALELQTREITSLSLSSPAFPISQVWPEPQWPQMFTNMIKDWQVENEIHLPWPSHKSGASIGRANLRTPLAIRRRRRGSRVPR
jgi:hypothetical protein